MTIEEMRKALKELDEKRESLKEQLEDAIEDEQFNKYVHKAFKVNANDWKGIVEFTGYDNGILTAIQFSCDNLSIDWDEYYVEDIPTYELTPVDDFKTAVLEYIKEHTEKTLKDMGYKKGMDYIVCLL